VYARSTVGVTTEPVATGSLPVASRVKSIASMSAPADVLPVFT
jgi:hypothetical protein